MCIVSVIVPLFNKADSITECLDSILIQTLRNFELIVVDDGSSDNSAEIVMSYNNGVVKLIQQENKGPGAARNAGLAIARGVYAAFLDADDQWLPSYLEEGVAFLSQQDLDVASVSFGCKLIGGNTRMDARYWDRLGVHEGLHRFTGGSSPLQAVSVLAYMTPCSTIVRTDVARKYGGFFDAYKCLYGEDAAFFLKLLLNCKVAISRRELVIVNKASSVLSANLPGPHPIEPFLADPTEIMASCPPSNRKLLEGILAYRAIQTSEEYAKFGRNDIARQLLAMYCGGRMPLRYYRAKVLCLLAPFLPRLLPYYRRLKLALGVKQ